MTRPSLRDAPPGESRTPRERRLLAIFASLFLLGVGAILAHDVWKWITARAEQRERLVVWLPFAAAERARCAQGAMGAFTHGGIFAWDFELPEGRAVVAAAEGRVIRVIDDRSRTGLNNFDDSNQVFVDHGGGLFATYLHHRTGSARVVPGQRVAAGAQLAEVGAVGTTGPHIHFDLRGPSWHQTHDLRFRAAAGAAVEVAQGGTYVSATASPEPRSTTFHDSRIAGDEFEANGIRLVVGRRAGGVVPLAFLMHADRTVTYRGRVGKDVQRVYFFLWRDGQPSEYVAEAWLYENGHFELPVRIPPSSRGTRWYRITTQDASGRLADVATLPVLVQ